MVTLLVLVGGASDGAVIIGALQWCKKCMVERYFFVLSTQQVPLARVFKSML